MRVVKCSLLMLVCSLAMMNCAKSGDEMADLALVNGSVWTANPSQPWAEAVATD